MCCKPRRGLTHEVQITPYKRSVVRCSTPPLYASRREATCRQFSDIGCRHMGSMSPLSERQVWCIIRTALRDACTVLLAPVGRHLSPIGKIPLRGVLVYLRISIFSLNFKPYTQVKVKVKVNKPPPASLLPHLPVSLSPPHTSLLRGG